MKNILCIMQDTVFLYFRRSMQIFMHCHDHDIYLINRIILYTIIELVQIFSFFSHDLKSRKFFSHAQVTPRAKSRKFFSHAQVTPRAKNRTPRYDKTDPRLEIRVERPGPIPNLKSEILLQILN